MSGNKTRRRATAKASTAETITQKIKRKNVTYTRLKTDSGHPVKEESAIFYLTPGVAFNAILCLRIVSAIWLHITDCDETFNYWEPSHFLMFDEGLQTWEYSPQFALRSYLYVSLFTVPAWIYNALFNPAKIFLFYFVRCIFAVVCTASEVYLYKGVCREFGVNIGRIMLAILIFSPGMFIASTSFLPSSFSMYMTSLLMGAWFLRKYSQAIFFTALSAFVSWPFAALIGVPICIEMLVIKKRWSTFVQWSIISAVTILIPLIGFDSCYYGKFVLAPWNIVKYNIFTSHGPNLYGTEPWTFYFLNGILNFNIAFVLTFLAPILLVLVKVVLPEKPRNSACFPYLLSLGGFFLWMLVFGIQPHKEERFLFPVYPLIALCSAVAIDSLQALWFKFFVKKGLHYAKCTVKIALLILIVYSSLGLSRMMALYKAYHAPMDTFIELTNVDASITDKSSINLCIGKEWYRFPNSYFLPHGWKVQFIRSEFKGLLPGYYSGGKNATRIIRTDMNDENKDEPSRYVDIDKCDYLVDMDTDLFTELEPTYSKHSNWTSIYSTQFLDAQSGPPWIRSFYIPWLWESRLKWNSYHLLKKNTSKRGKKKR